MSTLKEVHPAGRVLVLETKQRGVHVCSIVRQNEDGGAIVRDPIVVATTRAGLKAVIDALRLVLRCWGG